MSHKILFMLTILFFLPTIFAQETKAQENLEERRDRIENDSYFDTLKSIDKKGVHTYSVKPSPINSNFGIKIGFMNPPQIDSQIQFERIYDYNTNFLLLGSYEFKVFKNLGHMGLKLDLGLMFARGKGIFADPGINADKEALEKYTLLILPLSVGLNYKLQYWSNQFLVPFGVTGVDLFNILEIRDDGIKPSVLSAPAFHFGGGILIAIDKLSRSSVNTMEKEYGINHMYIVLEVRQYIDFTASVNLNNTLFLGGISFDF